MSRPLRVAVIGSGPAGVYASDALMKSGRDVRVDLFEKMPAPFGLIRYGVAPDHPRIKGIIKSLHRVMDKEQLRLFSNVEFGKDLSIEELKELYDGVIFATGAVGDRELPIPGADLPQHWGAGEFVGFYDGNPLFPRDWDLSAESVAVVGVGNVGLDVARILAKTADELHVTEIPDNVYETLKTNQAKEVHIFGRRGPAQAKFTPLELKELDLSPTIQVVVNGEDIDYDEVSAQHRRDSKITDQVCQILEMYAMRDLQDTPHKIYIHFFESPVEILGEEDADGNRKVVGFRTERTELDGKGGVRGTGKFTDWPVQAVYSAVGYRSDALPGVPFDTKKHVIPNIAGRVILSDATGDESAPHITGLYTTGWVKRGPVGLIGNTKGDANETVACLLEDFDAERTFTPTKLDDDAITALLNDKGVDYLTWDNWHALDAFELASGEAEGRERKKVVEWDDMVAASKK
ncbi:FAD-dependent oxidoreductase [Corynebacterium sp. H113]|uniref:FAD-dependent oxidoreductase n=1 Tax=Corynebacterium sp. H113 TaxID=3133419 RepID=UPI003098DF52